MSHNKLCTSLKESFYKYMLVVPNTKAPYLHILFFVGDVKQPMLTYYIFGGCPKILIFWHSIINEMKLITGCRLPFDPLAVLWTQNR